MSPPIIIFNAGYNLSLICQKKQFRNPYHGARKEKTFYCKKHRMDRFDHIDTGWPYCDLADVLSWTFQQWIMKLKFACLAVWYL